MKIAGMHITRALLGRFLLLVIGHLRSFFCYYAASRPIEIESHFNLAESLERLLALEPPPGKVMERLLGPGEKKVINVHISKRCRSSLKNPFRKVTREFAEQAWMKNQITVCYAHRRSRSNILQLFTGTFEETGGKTLLRGQVGMEPGARVVLGVFCITLFILFPALKLWDAILKGASGSLSGMVIVWLVFWGMLETFYWYGKSDAVAIVSSLRQALEVDGPDLRTET